MILSSALRRVEQADVAELLREGVGQVEREIENLRAIITELRPAALDELGLVPAIEALVGRVSAVEGLEIACRVDVPGAGRRLGAGARDDGLPARAGGADERRQARRRRARARQRRRAANGRIAVEIADDGVGLRPARRDERLRPRRDARARALSGGQLTVTPGRERHDGARRRCPLSELDEAVVEGVAHEIGA